MRAHAARPILQCVPAVYCAAMPHGTYQRMQQTQSSSSSDNYHSAIIHPPAPLVLAISIHCRSRSSSISWDMYHSPACRLMKLTTARRGRRLLAVWETVVQSLAPGAIHQPIRTSRFYYYYHYYNYYYYYYFRPLFPGDGS